MKRKFIKMLSVTMAMLTLVMASVMPASAADTEPISREIRLVSSDDKGNIIEYAMAFERNDREITNGSAGAYLYIRDELPTRDPVCYEAAFLAYYKHAPSTAKGVTNAKYYTQMSDNTIYRIATGKYEVELERALYRVESWARLRHNTADSTEILPGLNCRVNKTEGQLLLID